MYFVCSNNTNKLSPQEPLMLEIICFIVQIIQINLALKNEQKGQAVMKIVQIIQINLALKNHCIFGQTHDKVQIIQINLALKNLLALL